jgi:hypothetical protein
MSKSKTKMNPATKGPSLVAGFLFRRFTVKVNIGVLVQSSGTTVFTCILKSTDR